MKKHRISYLVVSSCLVLSALTMSAVAAPAPGNGNGNGIGMGMGNGLGIGGGRVAGELPPGLANRDNLPPGLANQPTLPPGLGGPARGDGTDDAPVDPDPAPAP